MGGNTKCLTLWQAAALWLSSWTLPERVWGKEDNPVQEVKQNSAKGGPVAKKKAPPSPSGVSLPFRTALATTAIG